MCIYLFGTPKFELSLLYTAWPRVAENWEMRVDRWSGPHLLSISDDARGVVAEGAANQLRGTAGEAAILKRSFFGRRPVCRVFYSAYRCSRRTPWRIKGSVYDVHTTLGGAFGLAMVLERGGREHRAISCFMVQHGTWCLDYRFTYLSFMYLFVLHTLTPIRHSRF